MSKKKDFIDYVENLMNYVETDDNAPKLSTEAAKYWEAFKQYEEVEKPLFTDNGKIILKYLQDNQDTELWKAKDIAEGLFISSRTVSGAIRKLVTDGFVDKVGQDPVIYTLTENGKNIEIN